MRKSLLFCLLIGITLIASNFAHATTVQRLSLEDMTKKARSIVVGNVRGARTYWEGKVILTTYTMDVQETIKGQGGRTIEVTTVGGTVGDTTLHVSGMAAFRPGENAVVFIEQSGPFSTVVGLAQGKFTVDQGEVANSVSDLSFPDGKSGRQMKMPLGTFKTQIKMILERQR